MALVSAVVGAVAGGFLVHKLTMSKELLTASRAGRTTTSSQHIAD